MATGSAKLPSQRQLRVGEIVRHALTDILQRGDVREPVLEKSVLSISEVSMSPDLKQAMAYVSPLGVSDPAPIIDALNANAKFIRGRLTPALRQMKFMPRVNFKLDTSFENFSKIDEILRSPKVSRDLGEEPEGS